MLTAEVNWWIARSAPVLVDAALLFVSDYEEGRRLWDALSSETQSRLAAAMVNDVQEAMRAVAAEDPDGAVHVTVPFDAVVQTLARETDPAGVALWEFITTTGANRSHALGDKHIQNAMLAAWDQSDRLAEAEARVGIRYAAGYLAKRRSVLVILQELAEHDAFATPMMNGRISPDDYEDLIDSLCWALQRADEEEN